MRGEVNVGAHGFTGRRRGALALAAAFVVGWAGCVSLQPKAEAAKPVARVAIANLTDYTWEIEVRPAAEGAPRAERLEPRTMAQWNLADGEYVIEQKLVGAMAVEPVRRFAARFKAGVDYNWSLATLHSTDAAASTSALR